MTPDFRQLIAHCEQTGTLLHIKKQVDCRYEAAALMKETKGKTPMLFERVAGYSGPMVTGLGGTRALLAQSMGVTEHELVSHLSGALVHPIPVTAVNSAPVHENVVRAPFDIHKYIPILTYNELDNAPYTVSGMMVARSISGERLYTSIRRMQYLGGSRMTILITSAQMKEQFRYYEQAKKPMDIAIMFGVTPAVVLASQISTQLFNVNKLDVAGALLGRTLPVVRCKTVDVDVLADAEFVLEGQVKPWVKESEGPFGEMGGYYGTVSPLPVVEFSALTFRNSPIVQAIYPSGYEEKLPMAINREVALLSTIRQTVPGVRRVHITPGGIGRLHAVVQIHKTGVADGRQAALAAFASDKDLKHVVVVDDDIDIFDMEQVEWAIATRMQANTDVFIVSGVNGSPLEASHLISGTSAKMGIDATCPLNDARFTRTHIPGEEDIRLEDYL